MLLVWGPSRSVTKAMSCPSRESAGLESEEAALLRFLSSRNPPKSQSYRKMS
jgi:hypothetical protein